MALPNDQDKSMDEERTIAIHPNVLALIESHASTDAINQSALQFEPDIDSNILLCFAVHYEHTQYVKEKPMEFRSEFCPMLTAVCDKNHDMIDILMQRYECLSIPHIATEEWYGKIKNHRIVLKDQVYIYDALFEVDDVGIFQKLSVFLGRTQMTFGPQTVTRYAAKRKAANCFQYLAGFPLSQLTEQHSHNLPQPPHASSAGHESEGANGDCTPQPPRTLQPEDRDIEMCETILYFICSPKGRVTYMSYEEILRIYHTFMTPESDGCYVVTHSETRILSQLIRGSENMESRDNMCITCYCDKSGVAASKPQNVRGESFKECMLSLDIHSRLILDMWRNVIDNCKLCPSDKQRWLTDAVVSILENNDDELEENSTRYIRVLYLLNAMTTMHVNKFPCVKKVTFCSSSWLNVFAEQVSVSPQLLPVFHLGVKHFMILIRAYHRVIDFDAFMNPESDEPCFELPKDRKYARGVAQVVLSMLPHEKYEQYRLSVLRRQQLYLEERQVSDCRDDELENQWPEDAFEVSGPRSLKELCRLKLLEMNPAIRANPEMADQLRICKELKTFLTLGTLKWYAMDWDCVSGSKGVSKEKNKNTAAQDPIDASDTLKELVKCKLDPASKPDGCANT